MNSLVMGSERYLRLLRERPAFHGADIHITEIDKTRKRLIEREQGADEHGLEHEIERAIVVDPGHVAEDVVTMNSKALLHLDDEKMEVALVYPKTQMSMPVKFLYFPVSAPFSASGRRCLQPKTGPAISGLKRCCINPKLRAIFICSMACGASVGCLKPSKPRKSLNFFEGNGLVRARH